MSEPGRAEDGESILSSPAIRPCLFYKLMDASSLKDTKLRIPKKFANRYGDQLASVSTLVLPNGDNWLVKLTKVDHNMWFTYGWHDFLVRHSISAGSLLMFKYEGNSMFYLSIFDLTAYEINYRKKIVSKEKQFPTSHGKVTETNSSSPCPTSAFQSNVGAGCLDQKKLCANCFSTLNTVNKMDSNNPFVTKDADNIQARPRLMRDVGLQFNGSNADVVESHSWVEATRSKRRKQKDISCLGMEVRSSSIDAASDCETVSSMKKVVTIQQKRRAIQLAEQFKPTNPHCRVVLRPSFISNKILHVPTSFASKYLRNISEFITLEDSNGNRWSVRCVLDRHAAKLSQGWYHFVRDHSLEEGDVCVFELIETKDVVLKTTIFRVQDLVPRQTNLQSGVRE